jgi:hypothetical protein
MKNNAIRRITIIYTKNANIYQSIDSLLDDCKTEESQKAL